MARILVFLSALVLTIFFANERSAWGIFFSVIPAMLLFTALVNYHNRVKYNKDQADFLTGINTDEVLRIKGDLGKFDPGQEFLQPDHPYTADLDVFGKNSLFQLFNRTSTQPGRSLLATWLMAPATKVEISARQESVKEMADELEWRQQFQASAMHSKDSRSDFNEFQKWLDEPQYISNNIFYKLSTYLLPTVALLCLFGVFSGFLHYGVLLLILAINGGILYMTFEYAKETSNKAAKSLESINSFQRLIKLTEERSFKSQYLVEIKARFVSGDISAFKEIQALSRIMQRFDSRSNMLYFIIDLFLLYDIHLLRQAESWKLHNRKNVQSWILCISKLEALASLAGSLYTHDEFIIPQISDNHSLVLESTGHPLIKKEDRVTNDFRMENGLGSEVIITGSNMSGKSTFLRTIGINMVMAFCGGPVCCMKATIPLVQVYTSMRTQDNLEEHISSFYAELKRIKGLLDLIEESSLPVFYLLDEILKGTNSIDRHLGAESLMIQLLPMNGMGLISTHDINLAKLEEKNPNISNYSFNSSISGNEIKFDYKIQRGVCRGFNASKLMEKMGIVLQLNKE